MCQTVSEQGRQDVYCVPLHDSDLLSGDGTHGSGDLSLVVETGTPFLLVEGRRSRWDIELDWHGLGDPEGTDVAVCTAPFQVYMPHLISSERFLKGRQGLQKQIWRQQGRRTDRPFLMRYQKGNRVWCCCDTRYMVLYGGVHLDPCAMQDVAACKQESTKGEAWRPEKKEKKVGSFSAFLSSWGSPWSVSRQAPKEAFPGIPSIRGENRALVLA